MTDSYWNPDSSGIGKLTAWNEDDDPGHLLAIGSVSNEFAGRSFTINCDNSARLGGIAINSTPTTVTLTGSGNNSPGSGDGLTWFVAAGSTLNQNNVYDVGTDTASSTPGVAVTAGLDAEHETVTLTLPLTSGATQFARLRVTVPPAP